MTQSAEGLITPTQNTLINQVINTQHSGQGTEHSVRTEDRTLSSEPSTKASTSNTHNRRKHSLVVAGSSCHTVTVLAPVCDSELPQGFGMLQQLC